MWTLSIVDIFGTTQIVLSKGRCPLFGGDFVRMQLYVLIMIGTKVGVHVKEVSVLKRCPLFKGVL